MTARERAKRCLKEQGLQHIIYGVRANGKTVEVSSDSEMIEFENDFDFESFVRTVKIVFELDMVLAVHA